MKRSDERREQRGQGDEAQDVVVVLPAKPGLREWWKKCREVEGLTGGAERGGKGGSEVGGGIHSKYGLEVAGVDTETGATGERQRGGARERGGGRGAKCPPGVAGAPGVVIIERIQIHHATPNRTQRHERSESVSIRFRLWLVRCFIDAIFGHSLGPGVSTRAGRGRSSP